MTIIQAIVFGAVQGFTEFLPISSTAHLTLLPWFMGWPDPGLSFDVALHLGTLVALLIYFRADWIALVIGALQLFRGRTSDANARMALFIIVATIPGALAGALFENTVETALAAWYWGAGRRIGFAAGGRGLALTDVVLLPEPRRHQIDEYVMLVEQCGARADDTEPKLTPPPADGPARAEARALLAEADTRGRRRTVGVHLTGATKQYRIALVETAVKLDCQRRARIRYQRDAAMRL